MKTYSTFDQFFMYELSGQLQPLERERVKISIGYRLAYLFIVSGGLLFVFTVSSDRMFFGFLALGILVTGLILLAVFYNNMSGFRARFKEQVVRRIIGYIDPSLHYEPRQCINRDDYFNSGLFLKKYDSYTGDDYVEGERDKTRFCFSELHTQYRQQSGKTSYNVTIFKGLFFIGDFNKHFHGRTYVWSRSNPQLGFITRLFSPFAANLEKVNLESSAFEQSFIVYSNDQVEARYILTPAFMERILKLREMMGEAVSFSFVNTNIHVAIPVRDKLFEPSLWSPNDYEQAGIYYNTVHIVFDIINELRLNDRLWSKQ